MPPRPRSSGLRARRNTGYRKYRKKPTWKGKVGNKKIKNLKKTKMGRVGLSAALALKTLKKHEPTVSKNQVWKTAGLHSTAAPDNLDGSYPTRAEVVHPYYLAKSVVDGKVVRSETARECDNIYMFNTRGEFEVIPPDTQIHPLVIRFVMGWAKGVPDANSGTEPTQAKTPWDISTANALSYYLQTAECTLPSDYFKVLIDRQRTYSPKMVYHDGSNPKAIWSNYKQKFNMRFNKKVMYDGDNPLDSIGWIPFIALLHYTQPGQTATTASTDSSNTHPSPTVVLDVHSFFKDC